MANVKRANTSGVTKSGVAIADVPDTPTIGTATAGIESATVTYTAATTGGTATTFTATSTPGSVTGTGSSPITVTGLTGDTSYTFTVRASNSTGNSPFSAASNSITAIAPAVGFNSIATFTVGSGGQSTITFSSIPSNYKHLQIRFFGRDSIGDQISIRVGNGSVDTGTNYNYHVLGGDGSTAQAAAQINQTVVKVGYGFNGQGSSPTANCMSAIIVDILDYQNTNKFKTIRSLGGYSTNSSFNEVDFVSGNWRSTSAINTITLGSGSIVQYSSIALYGIEG